MALRSSWCLLLAIASCGVDAVGRFEPSQGSSGGTPAASEDAAAGGAPVGVPGQPDGATTVPSSGFCDPAAPALLACFRFDGAAVDESGRALVPLAATNLGFVGGREGSAVELTLAPKSDLRLPFDTLNTPRATIEMWLRPSALPPAGGRAQLVDMNGRFGVTLTPDGTLQCRSVASVTKAAPGVWIHLACVHDGASLTTYVNGKAEASEPNTLSNTSDFVGIGQDSPSGGDGFEGAIDNLRFWSEPLGAAEVAASAAR